MDETIYVILKLLFHFALEVWFSIYRGSDMSAHALLHLLNLLGKGDKMRGLPQKQALHFITFSQQV